MKIKVLAAGAALASVSLLGLGAPLSHAATCDTATSQARDANGNSTGADTITPTPDGGTVYGAQTGTTGGYAGISGPTGYLDLSGADGNFAVQGTTTGGEANGNLTPAGLCLNGTSAP